jgi:glycolate oxidase subunit GlcD
LTEPTAIARELAPLIDGECRPGGGADAYLHDATTVRGLRGEADAIVIPSSVEDVAATVAWCYAHDVPITPRGGGTGYAGGAVPLGGGVVLSMERLAAVRSFDPLLWRIEVEAGIRTADLHRRARESGLVFPPDPGAAEDSQIGGNIATNAGGPHAFKYGVTRNWVSGLEAVVAPGEVIRLGGAIRKDQSGYDLKDLLIGSEGTLGIVTAAWLRLLPAPRAAFPVIATYPDITSGCEAIEAILGSGLVPAALEYLDGGMLALSAQAMPERLPPEAGFLLIAEADGTQAEATELRRELTEAMTGGSLSLDAPTEAPKLRELWRWRDGVSIAAAARRGGKVGEDIVVPVDRLAETIGEIREIGARHDLHAVSWGHAGDGNVHANFLVDPSDERELRRAADAADELFSVAVRLGGSISGEHGLGWLKRGQLAKQWSPAALELHRSIKHAFDPKNLFNPGKKA